MGKDIKRIVAYYKKLYNTNNPFVIADNLNIRVFSMPLGSLSGYYKYLKHNRCIFINSDIENETYRKTVMAHELGHAILHIKENCYFLDNSTFLLTSKIEKQANQFAAELLISDEEVEEYRQYSVEKIAVMSGYHPKLIEMRLN